MSDDDGISNPRDLLIGEGDSDGFVQRVYSLLGVQEERHVCEDCGTACQKATTHDPRRAAFDNGESASWHCPDCGTHYRREADTDRYTTDLYGRR